jgi:hypothetical protein
MPLPAARLPLPYVGTAGNQRSHPAARVDPQVRGLLRCGQSDHRPVRTHDVHRLQCRDLPGLPQATAASSKPRPSHDPRTRQRPLSPRHTPGSVSTSARSTPAGTVSAALQSATRPDRASLETGSPPRNPQSLLRYALRSARGRGRLLQSLAWTESSTPKTMLHYLRRGV